MDQPATILMYAKDERYRKAATELWANDNLEVDQDATVSEGEDGAWVHAWVWVSKDESLADVGVGMGTTLTMVPLEPQTV
jgi:hypothetical protein